MSQKSLRGHGPEISLRGSWRVIRIYGGETLKISKWVSDHGLYWLRSFQNHLHFPNQMSRNQNIVIWRFWSTTKLEVEGSQPVEPKISKWVFAHVFPLSHGTHSNWRNFIWMSVTFYQLLKIRHLLVIKEGEESQEDSLKIRSDENFLEAWLWILGSFLLDFFFSCDSYLSKCLNSQTWQTGWTTKIMCGRWKFDQKLKNWTWLHMIRFSFRIMKKHVSFDYEMSFKRFRWKCDFAIHGGKCISWKSMKEKVLKWWKEWFVFEKQVISLSFRT